MGNTEELLRQDKGLSELPAGREDIVDYLVKAGMSRKQAVGILNAVRKGKLADADTAEKYVQEMADANIPQWYIDACTKIQYVFPKSLATAYVYMDLVLTWYLVRKPDSAISEYQK